MVTKKITLDIKDSVDKTPYELAFCQHFDGDFTLQFRRPTIGNELGHCVFDFGRYYPEHFEGPLEVIGALRKAFQELEQQLSPQAPKPLGKPRPSLIP